MIVITGHATRQNQKVYEFPNTLLIEELNLEKKTFVYVRHSIDGKFFSELFYYSSGRKKYKLILPTLFFPSVMRYISEFFLNCMVFLIVSIICRKRVLYIGIDPLNGFAGVFFKFIKLSKKSIFYSVDFSFTRFKNVILNEIYLKIDSISASSSDQVWNVSNRIFNLRTEQLIESKNNKFVPNVPVSNTINRSAKKQNTSTLITLGVLGDQLDFDNLFVAIQEVIKLDKKIQLKIIGNGPSEFDLKKKVKKLGLKDHVHFLGYLDHGKALEEIASSDIGLALYNGTWSFNHFGDSLKCREFFSLGLPVITTDTHSTVEDMKKFKAGVVVNQNVKEYVNAILSILNDYNTYSVNSKKLGQKYAGIRMRLLKKFE